MPVTKRPAPGAQSRTGHPLPRRASPSASVTLRNHGLARDASLRASPGSGPARHAGNTVSSPRRNSSGASYQTGQSDPKTWFDQSNRNPAAALDHSAMDVDPPFFQRESDSSTEDKLHPYRHRAARPGLDATHSSSADDYRSVIDDLTVEIQKLKDELRRYKQKGPDTLRKDKLFEIKIHGLPMSKKRELESTLRDFAASLDGSPDAASSQRKEARHADRDRLYSASGWSVSKHASSSSGSNARPADSAYASMSTGANSSGPSLPRPLTGPRVRSSDQKVENYLRDIPEGLYLRHIAMTDKERKKLVVRRLEQLFTGKIGGRYAWRCPGTLPRGGGVSAASADGQPSSQQGHQPPTLAAAEPAREARILPPEQRPRCAGKELGSRDNGSASNSHGDGTESRGNGNGSGSGSGSGRGPGAILSPSNLAAAAEQRPTRLKDLDPDRVQVPAENMEYIRHLGLVPPEQAAPDVHPDSEGWVYLNLLCNLAQLHMINVTPSFVRLAVSEMSTKFQLSPDGHRIRWRGGSEGTKFSSDSSGDNSQRSPDTDDTASSGKAGSRKRQKTANSTGNDLASGYPSKLGLHMSASSESFHYKPLFVRQQSSNGQTSVDDAMSSFGPVEESNLGGSRWGLSGSAASNRRKRRRDGAIIYYNGAPFCADLSGDPGDVSPATYMLSSAKDQQEPSSQSTRPRPRRSESGSSICCCPLSDGYLAKTGRSRAAVDSDTPPGLATGSEDDRGDVFDLDLPWSSEEQVTRVHPLEPCGLGGVMPDDHFMVAVVTKRPREESNRQAASGRAHMDEAPDGIIGRLAAMSTSSPLPPMPLSSSRRGPPPVEMEYVSARIKRLAPVPLPPPATFVPPFSPDSSSDSDTHMGSEGDDESASLEAFKRGPANRHPSDGYPDGADLSSVDEDGEDPDDEPDSHRMYDVDSCDRDDEHGPQSICSAEVAPGTAREQSKSASERIARTDGSFAATVGDAGSGYSRGSEESR